MIVKLVVWLVAVGWGLGCTAYGAFGVTDDIQRQMLPAYGFYVRHADGVVFENVGLTYTGDAEARPAILADDSTRVETKDCTFRPPQGACPAVLKR